MGDKSIKNLLRASRRLTGCWIELFSNIAAEIMAMSGYDTAMIDLEHGAGSCLDAIAMMQAVSAHGCVPMIRATSSDPAVLKRVLDTGPAGLMIPNIRSAAQARDAVAACRYAPRGMRGAAPGIIRGTGYGRDQAGYGDWMENEFLLIGQVESKQAVEQIDEIAAVDGLDMLFVGPADLSASLGELGRYDSDDFLDAFERIERATLASGKWLGCIPFPGWSAQRLYSNGHSLVLSGADTLLLRRGAEEDVAALYRARD